MGISNQVPKNQNTHDKSVEEKNGNESFNMHSLIKVVNKLQEVFSVIGKHEISLPQIVVVGTQSSGKSSVLESLVGRSFLPRGTGIVTRAPLVLQMIKYSDDDFNKMIEKIKITDIKQWAVFSHRPDDIFYDFDQVRKEIEIRTDQLAGSNKGITPQQIILKVYTDKFDLTFVDLPGLTKVPVGDQPEDIDEQIQDLVNHYVKQVNTIILAVVTANTDPSTSESLKIARKMDPEGQRTIAVVTKLDLIDKGTIQDAVDLLCGRKIPVKLGIIGVVNRSQKDINDNKSLQNAIEDEEKFLQRNYPEICKFNGNKALANRLQCILMSHIKKTYPILKNKLEQTRTELEEELSVIQTPDSKACFVIELIKDISKSFADTINGNRKDLTNDDLIGGAKIVDLINKEYLQKIDKLNPLQGLDRQKIANTLLNSSGTNKCSVISEKALGILINRQLRLLITPSLQCVDLVQSEVFKIFQSIDEKILEKLKRFPKLYSAVQIKLNEMLDERVEEIKRFIESMIETYQLAINTTNSDFLSELLKSTTLLEDSSISTSIKDPEIFYENNNVESAYIKQPVLHKHDKIIIKQTDDEKKKILQQMLSGTDDSNKSTKQVKFNSELIKYYFLFVKKIVADFVPKRIQHKMVDYIVDEFEKYLIQHLFDPCMKENKFDDILDEDENIIKLRIKSEMTLGAVKKALITMSEVQYVSI